MLIASIRNYSPLCYRSCRSVDLSWELPFSIHQLGLVGHVEDIAVAKDQQGKKLGLKLIQALDYIAEKVGCYKCILDCSEANEGFYVKCGYKRGGLEMARYYNNNSSSVSKNNVPWYGMSIAYSRDVRKREREEKGLSIQDVA